MADNVTTQSTTLASPPAGGVYAFDLIDGVLYARSKTGWGADGVYGDVSAANPLPVSVEAAALPTPSSSATVPAQVADTGTSTTLIAANGTHKGFRITNTSSAVLYVKYGTTASTSSFTARLPQWAYLEENHYRGRVDGIWASDPGDGVAAITLID